MMDKYTLKSQIKKVQKEPNLFDFDSFPDSHSISNYEVRKIDYKHAKDYITNNHYTHGCGAVAYPCYGLFDGFKLIGVLMFACPCSEDVRASLFGKEEKDRVVELHRLHILDITPKNTESWFISRCLKLLVKDRPQTKGVISFSDLTQGHDGTIYKATNAYRCGQTSRIKVFVDKDGRLRHERQHGHHVTDEEAKEMGWVKKLSLPKNRYVFIVGTNRADIRYWKKKCLLLKSLT